MELTYIEIVTGQMSLSFSIYDKEADRQVGSAEGYLTKFGDLITVVKIDKELQGYGHGFKAFHKIFTELSKESKIHKIVGVWHRCDEFSSFEEGMSTNLRVFFENISKGFDPVKSARETPTGKWALKLGFNHCVIKVHSSDSVEVVFSVKDN